MTTKKNLSAGSQQRTSESLLKDIRRNTKRIFTSEQKVEISAKPTTPQFSPIHS